MTYDDFCKNLIEKYIAEHIPDVMLEYYATLTIEEAITEGSKRGRYEDEGKEYSDDHFKYFSKADLEEACGCLLRVIPQFKACRGKSFLDVYNIVRGVTKGIVPNLAELYWYDMAIRIAISKEIELEPEDVFLQRGARLGAEVLLSGLRTVTREEPYLPKVAFVRVSKEFERLKPDQIETMLCLYHREIEKFSKRLG